MRRFQNRFSKSSSTRSGGRSSQFGRSSQNGYGGQRASSSYNGNGYGAQNGASRFQSRPRQARRIKQLDPSLFVRKATEQVVEAYQPTHAFTDFALNPQVQQNVIAKGYTTPTPIQDQAIPALLEGRDMIGIASTGTGKTAAFLLPMITRIVEDRAQRALIIAPTRELAVQIQDELSAFAQGMNLYSALCIGGVNMYRQIKALQRNPNFVIGTPGRLRDLEKQKKLDFSRYNTIVLDEVDRMLDMGFVHEVSYIMSKLARNRQSLFFSATLSPEIQKIMNGFLNDPVTVSIMPTKPSSNVDQDVIKTEGKAKVDLLHDLLIQPEFEKVLVFGRTKWGMEKLAKELDKRGFKVAAIHGNKRQTQRQQAITDFKSNRIQVLLATDIASRGLDIDNVTHVINFDQPESYEDYIHRIGRTGRAEKKGKALTFVE